MLLSAPHGVFLFDTAPRLSTGRSSSPAWSPAGRLDRLPLLLSRAHGGRRLADLGEESREPFLPLLATTHVPYNNLAKLEEAVDDQIGVVLLEVVQGEGGVNLGEREFLEGRSASAGNGRAAGDR